MSDHIGWALLADEQQEAGKAAARLIEDADLKFVMMLYRDDRIGAIVSNIEPADAVELIEGALKAAKSKVATEDIPGGRLPGGRLQGGRLQ